MSSRLLGMYVHMHWGYNYPYAARTWSLADWRAYLQGLRGLGYNLVQIWPMIDTMPPDLSPSDQAHLEKLRRVIDIAHGLGLQVYVGASANTIGNGQARDFSFERRPYFAAEERINPGNPVAVESLMQARRRLLAPLAQADGFWIIDSDPGGYQGSTVPEFVGLLGEHRRLLDELRPGILLLYWMWVGWVDGMPPDPDWRMRSQPWWRETVTALARLNPEPWGIEASWPGHFAVLDELDLLSRAFYFAYGAVEDEPSIPWTHCDPARLEAAFTWVPQERCARGVLANAQSHILQMPHTYLFAHLAQGGSPQSLDLPRFAEQVVPGRGDALARAWLAQSREDPGDLSAAVEELATIRASLRTGAGPLRGLCLEQEERLIQDLQTQLLLKRALLQLQSAAATGQACGALQALMPVWEAWSERHGFADWSFGPLQQLLFSTLRSAAPHLQRGGQLLAALDDFGCEPRHGALERVTRALLEVTHA